MSVLSLSILSLAVTLTPGGQALRERATQIPSAVVQRLGMPIEDLEHLHAVLTSVIAAAQHTDATSSAG